MEMKTLTPEQVCDKFVGYICENKATARHVRRIASWLGLVIYGIDQIADDWNFHYTRLFQFTSAGVTYTVRYIHKSPTLPRGGLQIEEASSYHVVLELRSLADAKAFYDRPTLTVSVAA
jgi:hypothetical protein